MVARPCATDDDDLSVSGARHQIQAAMLELPNVSVAPHRYGGDEYRIGRRELGHVHGDSLVDIPFPPPIRDQVIAAGLARPHHVLPKSGWVSCHLREPQDVVDALKLLIRSRDLAVETRATRKQARA